MTLLFKALKDPTRRKILELLRDQELSAGEISDQFNMSKPSISHHLDILKQADLVASRRDGQFRVYSLTTTVLEDTINWLLDLVKDGQS
ncbi:MAG: winged helix-turn-helix transcriptional regulator [Rhodothermales bacterium]|nr:winged helix-turn-helix transcriptional regulator [Rhodothermales bacterium]